MNEILEELVFNRQQDRKTIESTINSLKPLLTVAAYRGGEGDVLLRRNRATEIETFAVEGHQTQYRRFSDKGQSIYFALSESNFCKGASREKPRAAQGGWFKFDFQPIEFRTSFSGLVNKKEIEECFSSNGLQDVSSFINLLGNLGYIVYG